MIDEFYIIILLILTTVILFFGGHNYQNKIEYESNQFNNLYNITLFEIKLQKYNSNIDFVDISTHVKLSKTIIPNIIGSYFVNIKPYELFNIDKCFIDINTQSSIMIIFNHNHHNNLELLIDKNKGFCYDLTKNISITGVFDIYNNSSVKINITLFILKKPFWHK